MGDTVRGPLKPDSGYIHRLRDRLQASGFDGAPRSDFLWAFVHPVLYGEGEPAARMLRVAVEAYGWAGDGLVDEMLAVVRSLNDANPEEIEWGGPELETSSARRICSASTWAEIRLRRPHLDRMMRRRRRPRMLEGYAT